MSQNKAPLKRVQVSITIIATVILLVHVAFPSLEIDEITLILFIVAIIPWVIPLFKSIEFPGGWKVEFQDYEEVQKKAKRTADKAIKSMNVELISDIKWNKAATLFWLGNDLMWVKDMTYRGAPPSRVIKGIDSAIIYAKSLGFKEDTMPVRDLNIAKNFITPLVESESTRSLDPTLLTNYYFNIQQYIENVKWYVHALASEQEQGFEKNK